MTWIKTIPRHEAEGALRAAIEGQRDMYPAEYDTPGFSGAGPGESIVEAHSLLPEALFHAFATFGALMNPALPLRREQHEMIATVVSAVNRCHYETVSHAEFLRRVTLDETLAEAIRTDYTTAPISDRDRVMLDYVAQLTRDATRIQPEHHDRLRAAGFDDTAILQ